MGQALAFSWWALGGDASPAHPVGSGQGDRGQSRTDAACRCSSQMAWGNLSCKGLRLSRGVMELVKCEFSWW